jgi:hypothetical protein
MAQDGNGARTTRSLMEAVAAVAPDLESRRVLGDRPDLKTGIAPPPLPLKATSSPASESPSRPVTPEAKAETPPPSPTDATGSAPAAVVAPVLKAVSAVPEPKSAQTPLKLSTASKAATLPSAASPTAGPADDKAAKTKRRPAGPSRETFAANDDVPTIGGLIYALNQKPSKRPLQIAAAISAIWLSIAGAFLFLLVKTELAKATGLSELLVKPALLIALVTAILPVAVAFGVAWLLYHAEDLRLRSSAMTEVAIRLAEPDRSAEQAVASLGQSVRKQVGYMNEAISQAIGRAGELEAMVHNEVSALEASFQQNETRIRGLLTEFSNQRLQLTSTSGDVHSTLRAIGDEVPALLEKLTAQQLKLSGIVEGAGRNLIALETQLNTASGQLEGSLATRTDALRTVLTDNTDKIAGLLTDGEGRLQTSFSENAGQVQTMLVERTNHLQTVLDEYTSALHASLGARTGQLQNVFEEFTLAIDKTLEARSQGLHETMIGQVDRMDSSMLERTKALDAAFATRLQVLDDSIHRSSALIDGALGEKARLLQSAMDTHAKQLADTLSRQSQNLDETLLQGIASVRRTSENITRQSVKAIEGLSGQADMLKNVSENLLAQIGTVTTRFENQGQTILRSANALESANYRIDQTLQARHRELTDTLGRVTESSEHIGQQMLTYKATIEGSMSEASERAKLITEDLSRSAQSHAAQTLGELQRLRSETDQQAGNALQSLRTQVTSVSREMQDHVGSLSSRLNQTSEELRARSRAAQEDLEREQLRLRMEAQKLPEVTRESVDGMRRMLAEQMRALDQVQQIAGRSQSDISPPLNPHSPAPGAQYAPAQLPAPSVPYQQPIAQPVQQPMQHTTLTGALAAAATASATAAPSSAWSLGDLLARASKDDAGGNGQRAAPIAVPVPVATPASSNSQAINLEQIATALDAQTAGAIWTRFRSGQRGILVRSIYSAEGRQIFDDVQRRYQSEVGFRAMIDRFTSEFERELRDIEARDTTGQALQQHLVSSGGRVYLFLAHASGRLN